MGAPLHPAQAADKTRIGDRPHPQISMATATTTATSVNTTKAGDGGLGGSRCCSGSMRIRSNLQPAPDPGGAEEAAHGGEELGLLRAGRSRGRCWYRSRRTKRRPVRHARVDADRRHHHLRGARRRWHRPTVALAGCRADRSGAGQRTAGSSRGTVRARRPRVVRRPALAGNAGNTTRGHVAQGRHAARVPRRFACRSLGVGGTGCHRDRFDERAVLGPADAHLQPHASMDRRAVRRRARATEVARSARRRRRSPTQVTRSRRDRGARPTCRCGPRSKRSATTSTSCSR